MENGRQETDRSNEALYSATCLEKVLPIISHKTELLGHFVDFAGNTKNKYCSDLST